MEKGYVPKNMLSAAAERRILGRYAHASGFQRWHMRGRLRVCPYPDLVPHLTGTGTLLDIGCGFGHLAWFLAEALPGLRYYGTDIDERKISLARGCPNLAGGPEFRTGASADFTDWPAHYGNIVLLDVLYLMPWEMQVALLDWALGRLSPDPGSALVIKSMEFPEGFSGWRAVAQEWVMVKLLGRTRSSGTLLGARDPAVYEAFARERGFQSRLERLGTFNPSYFLSMRR